MKDRECIKCERFFECAGKPEGANCIYFAERKKLNDKKRELYGNTRMDENKTRSQRK